MMISILGEIPPKFNAWKSVVCRTNPHSITKNNIIFLFMNLLILNLLLGFQDDEHLLKMFEVNCRRDLS